MNFQPIFLILNPEIITVTWIVTLMVTLFFANDYFLFIIIGSTFLYWIMLSIFIHIKLRNRFKNIQNSVLPDDMENPIDIGFFHSKTGIHKSLLYGAIPIVLILTPIFYKINSNDSWTKPFANTFGYLFFNNSLMETSENIFNMFNKDLNNDLLKKHTITSNKSIFVNNLKSSITNKKAMKENADTLLSLFYYVTGKSSDDTKKTEMKVIIQNNMCDIQEVIDKKYQVGNLIWYIIAGSIISLIVRYHVNNIPLDSL